MAEQYVDVVEWARTVEPEDPHDLRALEDVLLQDHPGNEERLERGEPDDPPFALLRGLAAMVYVFSPFMPLFGPVLFGGGWYRGNEFGATHISAALPWSGVAFWFAAAFWLHQIVRWWGHRYGDIMGIVFAVANIALAGLTLVMADAAGLDQFHGNATLHLIPIWATIVLAAVVIVVYAISPRWPESRMYTGDLTQESRELLLTERESALSALSDRGCWPRAALSRH